MDVTSTSTSQYSAETLITILERPSTSLSQSVDVVMETPDPEVILPGELRTVATRLCDPLAVTLSLHHSTPLEHSIFHLFPASLQAHQFYHYNLVPKCPGAEVSRERLTQSSFWSDLIRYLQLLSGHFGTKTLRHQDSSALNYSA